MKDQLMSDEIALKPFISQPHQEYLTNQVLFQLSQRPHIFLLTPHLCVSDETMMNVILWSLYQPLFINMCPGNHNISDNCYFAERPVSVSVFLGRIL